MYKIVHREFGACAYFPQTEEEAKELIEIMIAYNPETANQYYIRKL